MLTDEGVVTEGRATEGGRLQLFCVTVPYGLQ